MAHPARGRDKTSEWVELEEKVDDSIGPYGGRGKTMTVLVPGKGKKGQAKRVKLRVPASMIPELKRQPFASMWSSQALQTPTADATASRYVLFDDISQGTGSSNRLGDAIFVDRVVLRIALKPKIDSTLAAISLSQMVTILVYMDEEPDATVPPWTDLFMGIGAGNVALYDVAIPEQDKRFRFKYLREVRIPLEWNAAYWNVTDSRVQVSVKPVALTLDIPIKRRVMYDSTTAKPVRGCNVGVMGWTDDSSAATPLAFASYEIFFRDA